MNIIIISISCICIVFIFFIIFSCVLFNIVIRNDTNKDLIFKNNSDDSNNTVNCVQLENKESIYINSYDNLKLHANILKNDSSDIFVILIHGYSTNSTYMEDRAIFFKNKGYNILLPDLRVAGKSEGKYIGMGWLDRLDILKWI